MRNFVAFGLAAAAVGSASASIITQWDFNGTLNTTTPATAIGTGSASLFGGTTGASAGGSPNDPATSSDNRWNTTTYAAQGTGSGTRGVEYTVSTAGFQNIVFSADIRNSNTSSAWIEVLASYNGGAFGSVGTFMATDGDQWNSRTIALGAGADNASSVTIRIVSIFAPGTSAYAPARTVGSNYAASGTIGYDLVTFSGTAVPTPGSLALLALGGMVATRRRGR